MHRLSSPSSRPLLSLVASARPRWWPPALARREEGPLMAPPDPLSSRVSRFRHGYQSMSSSSGVRGEEQLFKPHSRPLIIPSAKDVTISMGKHAQHMKNVEDSDATKESIDCYGCGHPANGEEFGRRTSLNATYGDEKSHRETVEVADGKPETWGDVAVDSDRRAIKGCRGKTVVSCDEDNVSFAAEMPRYSAGRVVPLNIFPDSCHRDGSIYKGTSGWKRDFCVVDRRENGLEAMMLSNPTDCVMDEDDGTCVQHLPCSMLQIFSLKLAEIPLDAGKVELYGYIAARDLLEPLLNFVVNVSRDDPIIVEQGSLINMAPKRGINLDSDTLIDYDMKIKTVEHEKDDLQLIDGASIIGIMGTFNWSVFTSRIIGDCGAIDISASRLDLAVEATIEVLVSEVQGSFRLCLGCFTSGLHKEIRLFDGTIGEPP